ncbi:YopX family protein [Streptococcus oralis]|uniref:YopX family protein n=1 Tax=Streptococcus oralis TaxID=1303 RepID=UPI00080BE334|nr:YopX family protein [Streptococcus oralis]MDK7118197.1 YopX family protein [Streptococcus oralis]
MTPKFRAYDGGSLNRMYQPDEVMVGNGDIWIIDEDSVAGEWIVNNDLELMQSTGLFDKNGKEIFEGDIVSIDTDEFGLLVVKYETGIYWLTEDEQCVEHLSDYYKYVSVIGNIYENPELLEDVNETL